MTVKLVIVVAAMRGLAGCNDVVVVDDDDHHTDDGHGGDGLTVMMGYPHTTFMCTGS